MQAKGTYQMTEVISTVDAPQAIGPYSQAIKHNGLLFISGQIPIDPASGNVLTGNIAEQTTQVLKNLAAILKAAGTSRDKVLKTTVFIKDMNDFADMNKVYGEFFGEHKPARATVEVSRLPRDVSVEIELVAAC